MREHFPTSHAGARAGLAAIAWALDGPQKVLKSGGYSPAWREADSLADVILGSLGAAMASRVHGQRRHFEKDAADGGAEHGP